MGIGRGDYLALMMPDCPKLLYALWGLGKLGTVAVPVATARARLVRRSAPRGQVDAKVNAPVDRPTRLSHTTLAQMKRLYRAAVTTSVDAVLAVERKTLLGRLVGDASAAESLAAFSERRRLRFGGPPGTARRGPGQRP